MGIAIKQISDTVFEVNGKQVDTSVTYWGRNLTSEEYRCLQDYRRALKRTEGKA